MFRSNQWIRRFRRHCRVLRRGLSAMLLGNATAGLLLLALRGFAGTALRQGYRAVGDFLLAEATLGVGLAALWVLGRKGGGR